MSTSGTTAVANAAASSAKLSTEKPPEPSASMNQQSRWDEGSVMFALFSTEEWRNIPSLRFSASAAKDDKFTLMRKNVLQLLEHNALRQQQSLHLLQREWECLDNTLHAGVLQHDCHCS